MSIFSDNRIYPDEETPVLEHFSEFYDSVFVGFLPFFQMEDETKKESYRSSNKISIEQVKTEIKELEPLELKNVQIFSSNKDYPDNESVYQKGNAIRWKEIIHQTSLSNEIELNRALKTSIGAYKKQLERHELTKNLDEYTKKQKIWHPSEGGFDVFIKKEIYRAFKAFKKNEILVVDEFFEKSKELNLSELNEFQFIDSIDYKDYYIYSKDKDILFTIEWDSFFYLICFNKPNLDYIKEHFEGFLADENTDHLWDWKKGEIDLILNLNNKKSWWKIILK